MNPSFEIPQSSRSSVLLLIAVLLGILLYPSLERVLDKWMPQTQHMQNATPGEPAWDVRSMWQ